MCHYTRSYDLVLPEIDWEKVRVGIRRQIQYLVKLDENFIKKLDVIIKPENEDSLVEQVTQ